jgi:cell division protein FtsI (penicillin-binding protein 3)
LSVRQPFKETAPRKLDGVRKHALETGRNRLLVTAVVLSLTFAAIAVRVVDLTVMTNGFEPLTAQADRDNGQPTGRANILDRNGLILATSLPTVSLYADPQAILDAEDAAEKISTVLPGLNRAEILVKLGSKGRFVWLARNLTPRQHYQINRLGIPGVAFQRGERRVYPHGRLAAHVLGLTDVDGRGVAGIERYFDRTLRAGGEELRLSLDLRVQAILHEELTAAVNEFKAIGATGIVLDVNNGEVVAMVSLPDFDPNSPGRIYLQAVHGRHGA